MTLTRRVAAALVGLVGLTGLATPTAVAATPVGTSAATGSTAGGCVVVGRSEDPVRAVWRAGPGADVCLSPGTYRLSRPIVVRRGQTLLGSETVLDGSRVLRSFTRTRDGWVVRGQRQQGERTGTCLDARPECSRPDDVLRDGVPLRRVLDRDDLGPGRYWFDYPRDAIHLGSEPRGHRIEALVARAAVVPGRGATDVTLTGMTVQHFATPAQRGAIQAFEPGWLVQGTVVQDNHGAGITSTGGARILGNTVRRNGQLGIGGTGDDTRVEGNTIAGNGRGGYDPAWEAGGAKWAVTDGLRVVANRVLRNAGPGLWTDIDAQDTVYRRNEVADNTGPGIFHEISAGATIVDNDVAGNGRASDGWLWGAGILVAGSYDVDVVGNRLSGNAQGIGLVQQQRGRSEVDGTPRRLHEVDVRNNRVAMARGESGMVQDDGREELFDDETITWTGNRWTRRARTPFLWDDEYLSLRQWRALGHDVR